jgi:transcriptional regulator with XRE-family HTH domain
MEKKILEKLKQLREDRGYSSTDIAKYLNIEKTSFEKMENGTNNSWSKYFFQLMDKYEYTPERLFSEINSNNFIHQQINNNAIEHLATEEKMQYIDKPMAKSLMNAKDEIIAFLKTDILKLKSTIKKLKADIDQLRIENAYLKGKIGYSV